MYIHTYNTLYREREKSYGQLDTVYQLQLACLTLSFGRAVVLVFSLFIFLRGASPIFTLQSSEEKLLLDSITTANLKSRFNRKLHQKINHVGLL